MPPRARKATTPSPSLDGGAEPETAVPQEVAPGAEADGAPALGETAADAEPGPELAPEDPAAADPEGEPPTAAGRAVAALLAPPAVTYRWVSANGDGSAPCRVCNPGGPPAGAGSFGCAHGQWVRVADETT